MACVGHLRATAWQKLGSFASSDMLCYTPLSWPVAQVGLPRSPEAYVGQLEGVRQAEAAAALTEAAAAAPAPRTGGGDTLSSSSGTTPALAGAAGPQAAPTPGPEPVPESSEADAGGAPRDGSGAGPGRPEATAPLDGSGAPATAGTHGGARGPAQQPAQAQPQQQPTRCLLLLSDMEQGAAGTAAAAVSAAGLGRLVPLQVRWPWVGGEGGPASGKGRGTGGTGAGCDEASLTEDPRPQTTTNFPFARNLQPPATVNCPHPSPPPSLRAPARTPWSRPTRAWPRRCPSCPRPASSGAWRP